MPAPYRPAGSPEDLAFRAAHKEDPITGLLRSVEDNKDRIRADHRAWLEDAAANEPKPIAPPWTDRKPGELYVDLVPDHDCWDEAIPYESDGALGHGWECGRCGKFLQAG